MGRFRLAAGQVWIVAAAASLLAACALHGMTPELAVQGNSLADLGRRSARAPVRVAFVLRVNREAELTRLVDELADPGSPRFRDFLNPAAFIARFAPTPQQHARALFALRRAGFTILRTYPNRTLVDATAPSSVVERFFQTRIHDFEQRSYGRRYAAVTPLHVPAVLTSMVRSAVLDSVVYARLAAVDEPDKATPNAIHNGGFERKLEDWTTCDKVAISRKHPYAGKFSALIGSASTTSGAVRGLQVLCQRVVVPHQAVLTAHTYSITNVTDTAKGFQEIGLMRKPGKIDVVLRKGLTDRARWQTASWPLSSLEGQALYVFFAVYGRGQKALYDSMFVDGVSMIGTVPTPTPKPTPVGNGPGTPLNGPVKGSNGGWAPRGVADAFDMPVQHGWDGRGSTQGVLMQSAVRRADLNDFLSNNHVAFGGTIHEIAIDGGPKTGDPTEGMLDTETMVALAPRANLVGYEMPDFSNLSVLDALQTALNATANRPSVIEMPFGECDSDDSSFDNAIEQDAVNAAAVGITLVAPSGDDGTGCFSVKQQKNVAGTQVPASNPHVLSIGGNDSDNAGALANPVVWSGNNGLFAGASGGGISSMWALPSYQHGVLGSPASSTHRNVPDVAYPAVDDDLHIYGVEKLVGGTSWSSAIASALLAGSVEICGPLGYVNPAVYGAFARSGEGTVFLDVTSGSNAFAGFTPVAAAAGYDNASGIGMPVGFKFAAALCGKKTNLVRINTP